MLYFFSSPTKKNVVFFYSLFPINKNTYAFDFLIMFMFAYAWLGPLANFFGLPVDLGISMEGVPFLLGEEKLVSELDSRVELDKDCWVWTHNISCMYLVLFILYSLSIHVCCAFQTGSLRYEKIFSGVLLPLSSL